MELSGVAMRYTKVEAIRQKVAPFSHAHASRGAFGGTKRRNGT